MTDDQCAPSINRATDVIVTGTMATLSALTIWSRGPTPGDIAVGIVATALVPLLLRRPVTATVALTVLAAVSPAATSPATLGALYVARWRPFRVAIAVAAGGVAAHAIQGPPGGMAYGWWLVLISAVYAALIGWGSLWQANRALVESLRERARRAEADRDRQVAEAKAAERDRIAREMHDVLAHRLSLLATYAGALEYRPDTSPEKLSRAAAVIRDSAHRALVELREVITLMPGADDVRGLEGLPRLLDESRAVGADIEFVDTRATTQEVPDAIARAAYRVVQEAVTNARRHAPGQKIRVEVRGEQGENLTVEIRNRVATENRNGNGTGLIGLAERIRLAGGEFEHGRSAEEFHIRAELPWPA